MTRPKNRSDLLYQAEEEFDILHKIVEQVPQGLREVPGACGEWSVKDILAHLDVWHEMFLRWDAVGSAGDMPSMPAEGYNWSQIPALNHEIFERHRYDDWHLVETRLKHSYEKVLEVMSSYTDDDLFTKKRFEWTGSTSIASFAISASSSHYAWATKLIKTWLRTQAEAKTSVES